MLLLKLCQSFSFFFFFPFFFFFLMLSKMKVTSPAETMNNTHFWKISSRILIWFDFIVFLHFLRKKRIIMNVAVFFLFYFDSSCIYGLLMVSYFCYYSSLFFFMQLIAQFLKMKISSFRWDCKMGEDYLPRHCYMHCLSCC